MDLILIHNPHAGIDPQSNTPLLLEQIHSYGNVVSLITTDPDTSIVKELETYKDKAEAVVVAGGDGTISMVSQALVDLNMDIPLLIVPLGSTNEIAKTYQIPEGNILKALELLRNGEVTPVDIGLMNENQTFFYSLSFGNFTHVTYRTPQPWKNRLGHAAYWLYGFFKFRGLKIYKFKIEAEEMFVDQGSYVFGGISNSLSMGNVFHYDPREVSFNDGKMELILIRKPRSLKEFRLTLTALVKRNYDISTFVRQKVDSVTFMSSKRHSWNIDGEFAGKHDQVAVRVLPQRLKLYHPAAKKKIKE